MPTGCPIAGKGQPMCTTTSDRQCARTSSAASRVHQYRAWECSQVGITSETGMAHVEMGLFNNPQTEARWEMRMTKRTGSLWPVRERGAVSQGSW